MTLRLATRRSPLALLQAQYVADRLADHGVDTSLVPIETSGDQNLNEPLSTLGGQGIFAVEIQRAVLRGEADVAVHSAKDLPSVTPDGLALACVPERRDARDVLVGRCLADLAPGATVATGSPRRRALLLERRPDLAVVELRGNMASRLGRAGRDGVDAVVAAAAARQRLEQESMIAEFLDPSWFIPQVGQGALALECRADNADAMRHLGPLNNADASMALEAERAFLRELGAGCSIPVGAHATWRDGVVHIAGVMADPQGRRSVRHTVADADPHVAGTALARYLRDDCGGGDLIISRLAD